MILTQLSVKLQNKPGELSKVSDLLGDAGINIKALTASVHGADAQVHMVVDDSDKAADALKSRGYEVNPRQVLAVETPDHPGGLNAFLRPLKEAGINVEFLYPLIGKYKDNAVMIIGGDPIEQAIASLEKHYITILDERIYAL